MVAPLWPLWCVFGTMMVMSASVVDILKDLVAIPTVTGDFAANDAGLDYIAQFLRPYGMHITRLDYDGYGALVATTRRTKRPKVMLLAHLDVVPAPLEAFTLRRQNGKLYGRGSFDMKHAIAAFLAMVARMGEEALKHDFGIQIYTDDEGQDTQIVELLAAGYIPEVAVLPDGSEDWKIERIAKGIMHLDIHMSGKSSHGSRPWEGDSASLRMVEFLHELHKDFSGHGPETDTLNVGLVHSGSAAWNQVPDAAEATVDIRVMHADSHAIWRTRLAALASKYDAVVEEKLIVPPSIHDLQNKYFALFANCITKVTGVKSAGLCRSVAATPAGT
jgi:succinyl-diaminopimelate desuccinylase